MPAPRLASLTRPLAFLLLALLLSGARCHGNHAAGSSPSSTAAASGPPEEVATQFTDNTPGSTSASPAALLTLINTYRMAHNPPLSTLSRNTGAAADAEKTYVALLAASMQTGTGLPHHLDRKTSRQRVERAGLTGIEPYGLSEILQIAPDENAMMGMLTMQGYESIMATGKWTDVIIEMATNSTNGLNYWVVLFYKSP